MTKFNKIPLRDKITITLLITILVLALLASVTFANSGTLGDINGDGEVNVQDVTLTMRHVLELETLDSEQQKRADVNGDGEINVLDVTLIMQYALGLIDTFPAE